MCDRQHGQDEIKCNSITSTTVLIRPYSDKKQILRVAVMTRKEKVPIRPVVWGMGLRFGLKMQQYFIFSRCLPHI